jgi:hypothetical protein
MAGVGIRAITPAVALVAATKKTALQIIAASDQRVLPKSLVFAFDYTGALTTSTLVQLIRGTTSGTSSALPLAKEHSGDPETPRTTAKHTFTAEPTGGTVIATLYVAPQSRYYVVPLDVLDPIVGADKLDVAFTVPANCNVVVSGLFEE